MLFFWTGNLHSVYDIKYSLNIFKNSSSIESGIPIIAQDKYQCHSFLLVGVIGQPWFLVRLFLDVFRIEETAKVFNDFNNSEKNINFLVYLSSVSMELHCKTKTQ